MPNSPSGGNRELANPEEYWVAAPSVWPFAYGETSECFGEKIKGKNSSTYSQASNGNNIGILLAADG
jgi:hypothetical protein